MLSQVSTRGMYLAAAIATFNSLLGKTLPSCCSLSQLRYNNKQDTHLNIEVEFAWFAFVVKRSFWLSY